jgi:membrane protease YdiL (CAAX protease family)
VKKNLYTAFAIVFSLLIVLIQSLPTPARTGQPTLDLSITAGEILSSPWAILMAILSLFYLLIFFLGIGYLIFFLTGLKKRKKILFAKNTLPLAFSSETASKTLFYSTLTILLLHLLPAILVRETAPGSAALVFTLNGLMHVAIGLTVLRYIGSTFNFTISKEKIIMILKTYSALLPLLIASLFINSLITKVLSIEYTPGPALELLFSISNPWLLLLAGLQIIISGPLIEEMFFRGFLYPLFRSRYSFLTAAGLLSFFFAALHRTPSNIMPLFLISFTLCYIYEKTKSLTAVFVFHALHNGLNFINFLVLQKIIQG